MKILIIQQKMIGDVLTSSILFEVLRAEYPSAKLHYLIYKHTIPVVENNPFIDHIIIFKEKYKKPKHLLPFLKKVRDEKYDVVIDVYSKLGTALISAASGAPMTISYKKWYTSFSYSHPVTRKTVATSNAGLAIEHRLDLLKSLTNKNLSEVKPRIYLTKTEIAGAKEILSNAGISRDKPLMMISVLGSSIDKTYPPEYLAKLLDELVMQTNAVLLFNYILSQKESAENTFQLCKPETQKNIHLEIYGKSLREFMALTSQCSALIGNEGGAVNMAKALDVPTFAIFSPQIPKNAWALFEGEQNVSAHIEDYKKFKKSTSWKNQYKEFTPDLFLKKFRDFLEQLLK